MKMDFANHEQVAGVASNASMFRLTCSNNSTYPWIFYIYQTMPGQPSDIFSLAWFASPYRMSPGSRITFTWTLDNSFVWGNSGTLSPGVTFMASQIISANANGANMTVFSMDNNTPHFSTPVNGGQPNSLTIDAAGNVPNGVFSTGIGMSGQATFVQQARANMRQVYSASTPTYWVAAASQMQMGTVLPGSSNMAAKFAFQPGREDLSATLNPDNTWTIN